MVHFWHTLQMTKIYANDKLKSSTWQGNITYLASCDHCAVLQPAAAEPVHRSNMCAHTGQMQLGHECTTQVGLWLDRMQTPHAAAAELLQMEGCYIASCHQSLVSSHVWQDMVQNDWTGHLGHHLYIIVMHTLEYINKLSKNIYRVR